MSGRSGLSHPLSRTELPEAARPASEGAVGFTSSIEHLMGEVERIDRMVRALVRDLKETTPDQPELRGLVVSDSDVGRFLERPPGLAGRWQGVERTLLRREQQECLDRIELRRSAPSTRQAPLRLDVLAGRFGLSRTEVDALLICLLPELDPEYGRQFGYIHDDVTRRQATPGLITALLTDNQAEAVELRSHLVRAAPVFRWGLIRTKDAGSPAQFESERPLAVSDRVLAFLLGDDAPDAELDGFAEMPAPAFSLEDLILSDAVRLELLAMKRRLAGDGTQCAWLRGARDSGKRTAAAALARSLNLRVLVADSHWIASLSDSDAQAKIRILYREALLQDAAVCWHDFDELTKEGKPEKAHALRGILAEQGQPTFFLSACAIPPRLFETLRVAAADLPVPAAAERERLWSSFLGGERVDVKPLATQFRFYPGQIRRAAARAREGAEGEPVPDDVLRACREQTRIEVKDLAQRVQWRTAWDDLILPPDRKMQLRELCNHVQNRGLVYDTWGMDKRIPYGRGLNALFSGPSGTGKTMAASLIAAELGLDLYRIDLAGVVNKYIGETEKNLARLFDQADGANLVLFFDEADALFGKRTEIRDSHDRFANIEIGYLLQRLDEHEGVVILATNLRRNLDDAFLRRFQYTIEFPLPGERERLLLWQRMWPDSVRLDPGLDPAQLARQYEFSGGNIRNVAVTAAFLAAADGGVVNAKHVARAVQREYQKMGQIVLGNSSSGGS
jgi:hypothetical protein